MSVLIPSHRPAMLAQALASVAAQTGGYAIQVLVNAGPEWYGDKINDLVRAARAPLLLPLCDDDEIAPTFVEETLAVAREHPRADFIYTDIQFFGDRTHAYPLPEFGLNVFRQVLPVWTTALIRRELWEKLAILDGRHAWRGYDPEQDYFDTDFWVRAAKAGARAAHLRKPLFRARDHAGNGGKLMDTGAALLRLQAKHADVYPGGFLPDREGVLHFADVPPVHVPERFRALAELTP